MDRYLQSCCCNLDWCKAVRKQHFLKDKVVRFNTMVTGDTEFEAWCSLLDINGANLTKTPRIWVGHFHEVDLSTTNDPLTGQPIYKGIATGMTRYDYNKTNSAYGKPSRPAATKAAVMQSSLFGSSASLLSSSVMLPSLPLKRRRKVDLTVDANSTIPLLKAPVLVLPVTTTMSSNGSSNARTNHTAVSGAASVTTKRGPKLGSKRPINESFVGTADRIVMLVEQIESHAKGCSGHMCFQRRKIKTKGLALKLRCYCSLKHLFRSLVVSWSLSHAFELILWRSVHYTTTTLCESYNHWMAIMVPKWGSAKPKEYAVKEAAANIIFKKRQLDKELLVKALRGNKNTAGMTATAGQHPYHHETYILDALQTLCASCTFIQGVVAHRHVKQQLAKLRRHARAVQVITAAAADSTQTNLGLGAVQKQKTEARDGLQQGMQTADPVESARLVSPFPFRREVLLITAVDLQRIELVWARTVALSSHEDESPAPISTEMEESEESTEMDS